MRFRRVSEPIASPSVELPASESLPAETLPDPESCSAAPEATFTAVLPEIDPLTSSVPALTVVNAV